MGIVKEIVDLAFGLTVGAIALAYGLGEREAAGKHAEDLINKIRGRK